MDTTAQASTQVTGYAVVDPQGNKIGTVDATWLNGATNDLQFIGIKTGWLVGKTHVVPMDNAQVDGNRQTIQIPYTADQIKDAPTFDPSTVLSQGQQNQITGYFQNLSSGAGNSLTREVVAVPAQAVAPGQFPVDNILYDLYTLIAQKLQGLEAYDQYLQDTQGDNRLTNLLTQLREQDARGVELLQQELVGRLSGQAAGNG